jgi:hypothetical protein
LISRGRVPRFSFQQEMYFTTWCGMAPHRHNLRWTVISRTMKVDANLPVVYTLLPSIGGNKSVKAPNQSWRRKEIRLGLPVPRKTRKWPRAWGRRCPTTVFRARQGSVMHHFFMDLPVSDTRTTWRSLSQDRRPRPHPPHHRFY